MKKRLCATLSVIFACSLAFAGCSSERLAKVNVSGSQDTKYAVTSNGGSAVQYGNYVYFINGTRGFDDDNAKNNVFGSVVKGGLCRVELNGSKVSSDNGDSFRITSGGDAGSKLVGAVATTFDNKTTLEASVQTIAPKTIGTSGYHNGGGVFIFGNYVYYASPDNTKNKQGETTYKRTAFFREKLDGSETIKIYTTQAETADKGYGFYNYGGAVYLVTEDERDGNSCIISVRIASDGKTTVKRIGKEKHTQAIFPTNPTYYSGISTDTVYDYIYLKYSGSDFEEDKTSRTDNVLAYIRPDGSEFTKFAEGNDKLDFVAVRDDLVYYINSTLSGAALIARDYDSLFTLSGGFNQNVLTLDALTSATQVYPAVLGLGEINTNRIHVFLVTDSKTLTDYTDGGRTVKQIDTASTSLSVQATDEGKVFYAVSDTENEIRYYDLYADEAVTIASDVTTGSFDVDLIDNFVVYMGVLEERFDSYTFFYDLASDRADFTNLFVGKRNAGDRRSKINTVELNEEDLVNVKTVYKAKESLDVNNLYIILKYYPDEDGVVEEERVAVKKSWVSGFDSSKATDELELTITYTDEADTFNVVYTVEINS
jgi:hypothetical protein